MMTRNERPDSEVRDTVWKTLNELQVQQGRYLTFESGCGMALAQMEKLKAPLDSITC